MAEKKPRAGPGRALDRRYLDDDILGVHCRAHGHLAALGLSDHDKCSGWWKTGIDEGVPIGFRCACDCHDNTIDNP